MLQVKKLTPRDLTCHKTGLPVASGDGTSATAGEGGRGADWRSGGGGGRLPAPANSGEGGGRAAAQLELDPSRDQLVFEGDTLRLRCRLLAQPLHQEAVLR
jgi:hypothetical protein